MTAPGWYYAEGDAPGTTRYWDGTQWIGDPVFTPPAAGGGGYVSSDVGGLRSQLASPGIRIGARLIDLLIVGIIVVLFALPIILDFIDGIDALGPNPTSDQTEQVLEEALEGRLGVAAIGLAIAFFWDLIWVAAVGGTPGKLLLGLRVARSGSGASPPGFGKAILRWLNRLVALIPLVGFLVFFANIASLIMLFTDDEHRTVMDRIAGTLVIKK